MADSVQLFYDLAPAPQLQSKLQRQMAEFERTLQFKSPFAGAARDVRSFATEMERANQRVISLGASFAILYTSLRTLKEIVLATVEVEKAFTEINTVFNLGARDFDKFGKQLFDVAKNTSQAFNVAASAAKEFSRQGLTAEETLLRTRDALVLTRLANLDAAKSVETLTASLNGFQKSALTSTEIVNKLATVDARFAVSSADLAEGLSRAGAAASDAGVSFDQLLGIITAVQQTTARGGAVIGNALKTIFTRVEKPETIDALRSLGVVVDDVSGSVLGALPLLQNFAQRYDELSGPLKKQAALMVGGVYQINILKAALNDLAKANGITAQATDVAANASNEALKRNEALNKSLDATLTRLGTVAKQVGSNIGSLSFAGPAKTVASALADNPIVAALQDASGRAETAGGKFADGFLKSFGAAVTYGLGPLVIAALGKVAVSSLGNLFKDFGDLSGITRQSSAQKAIQQELVSLYQSGGMALQHQLATLSTMTERAALLQRLLSAGGAGNAQAAQMASALYQSGYRPKTPTSAGGHIPFGAEASAIARGVGGAPAGAQPVYLPSFNRGGGQRGIVANTSEWMVSGAAGGAIFNRDMIQKYGLPPGAKPVAAEGFIPTASFGSFMGMGPPSPNMPPFGVAPGTPYGSFVGGSPVGVATGQGFGQYMQPSTGNATAIAEINKLLNAISNSSTIAGAEKFTDQIMTLTKALDKPTARQAMKVLGTVTNDLNQKIANEAQVRADAQQARIRAGEQNIRQFQITRQGVLNAAGQRLQMGDAFSDLTPAQQRVIQAQVREKAVQQLGYGGFSASDINSNPTARAQINQMVASQIGRMTGTPPTMPDTVVKRSLLQRLSDNKGALAVTGAFALPALGALVPDRPGGTPGAASAGALGGALTGAGFGAAVGLPFGGAGAAIGGTVGVLTGAAMGALRKMEQSFEELAQEINEAHAKIQRQVEYVQSAFRLQSDIATTLQNPALNPEQKERKLYELRKARTQALLNIRNPKTREEAIRRINDPDGLGHVTDLATAELREREASDNLAGATRRALDTSKTFGMRGYGEGASSEIARALVPLLGELGPEGISGIASMVGAAPVQAFSALALRSGMDPKKLQGLVSRTVVGLEGTGGHTTGPGDRNTTLLLQEALNEAIADVMRSGILPIAEVLPEAEKAAAKFTKSLREMASEMEFESQAVEIRANERAKVRRVENDIFLSRAALSEGELIAKRGLFAEDDISGQFGSRRRASVSAGQGDLLSILAAKGGSSVDSMALRDRIGKMGSLESFQMLRSELNSTEGLRALPGIASSEFKAAVEKHVVMLKLLALSEGEEIEANRKITKALLDRYNEMGTFGGATAEDAREMINSGTALSRGFARNDPIDVIERLQIEDLQTRLRAQVRSGSATQGGADATMLATQMSQSLAQQRRQMGAFGAVPQGLHTDTLRGDMEFDLLRQRRALSAQLRLPDAFKTSQTLQSRSMDFDRRLDTARTNLSAAQAYGAESPELMGLNTALDDLHTENAFRTGRITEGGARLHRARMRATRTRNNAFSTGTDIANSDFATASEQGLQGDATGSFAGGFQSVFNGLKRDLMDFAQTGAEVAESLQGNLTSFWTQFVTGAKQGKDAFREFAASVLTDASRMLASKAFTAALSAIPGFTGFGAATGGRMGFAAGGMVPALVTGGEYYFSPESAKRIGYGPLQQLNRYAEGGTVIRGGSGVRDDVPARMPTGSFILKQSAVKKLGVDYLDALSSGRVQKRWLGGALLGALLGGGIGYATGGTKGAIGGALLGGIGGGLYSANSAAMASSAGSAAMTGSGSVAGLTLSTGAKVALGLGASAGLGLLGAGLMDRGSSSESSYLSMSQVPALRRQLEAEQGAQIAGARAGGNFPYLQVNPQGGYSLAGFGPATRHWAEGGGVGTTTAMSSPGVTAGGSANVNIEITINNNGGVSSEAKGGEPFGEGSGARLEKVVKGWVNEEVVRMSRNDGFLTQRERYS